MAEKLRVTVSVEASAGFDEVRFSDADGLNHGVLRVTGHERGAYKSGDTYTIELVRVEPAAAEAK